MLFFNFKILKFSPNIKQMNITYRNKVVQNGLKCILVFASIFLISNKCFSREFPLATLMENKINSKLVEPFRQVNNVLDLVNSSGYQQQLTNTVNAEMVLLRNFKWIFKANGISLVKPAIDSNSGALYVPTTDVDISIDVRDLAELGEDSINIGNLQGKLYCLRANPVSNRGRKEWEIDTNGITVFPPVVSGNGNVFVESVDGDFKIDLENLDEIDLGILTSRLTAIDNNGNAIWNVDFDNSSFISKPMVAPDDSVITTTVTIPDLPKISDINPNELDLDGFSANISVFDSRNGNIKWTFNPASLESENHLALFTPPTVAFNEGKIFSVASSRLSSEELQKLATEIVEDIEQSAIESVLASILQIVAILSEGGDANALIDDLENDIARLINDPLKTALNKPFGKSELFAIDTDGNILWQAEVPGLSLFSPLASDSGLVNVCTLKVFVEEISSSVDMEVELSPQNLLTIDTDVELLISGEPVVFGLDFSFDASRLGDINNISEILDILETDIERPKVSDLINILSMNLISEYFAYNTSDGELLWSSLIDGPVFTKPVFTDDKQQIINTVNDLSFDEVLDSLELQSVTSHIYSLDANNGDMKWESDPINGTIIPPVLTDKNNCVYYSFIEDEKLDFNQIDFNQSVAQIGAVDSNGLAKWAIPFKPDDLITSVPVIDSSGALYVPVSKVNDLIPSDEGMESGNRVKLRELRPDIKGEIIEIDTAIGTAIKSIALDGFIVAPSIIDESRNALYTSTINFTTSVNPISIELLSCVHATKTR